MAVPLVTCFACGTVLAIKRFTIAGVGSEIALGWTLDWLCIHMQS